MATSCIVLKREIPNVMLSEIMCDSPNSRVQYL